MEGVWHSLSRFCILPGYDMRTVPKSRAELYQLIFALFMAQRQPRLFLRYPCPVCRCESNQAPTEVPTLRNMIAEVEAVVPIAPALERAHSLHIPVRDYFCGLFVTPDMVAVPV